MIQQPDPENSLTDAIAGSDTPPLASSAPFSGKAWRSWRGEPIETPSVVDLIRPVMETLDGSSRRDFLRFMAASLALGGIGGCAYQPAESIVPYVQAPESIVPGESMFFATATPMPDGFACGVLVKSQMGRPLKIEGNPDHPASLARPTHSRRPPC